MNDNTVLIIGAVVIGIILGYLIKYFQVNRTITKAKDEAERILNTAKEEATDTRLKAKDKAIEMRERAEKEINRRRSELSKEEDRLQRRRNEQDKRTEKLEQRELSLNKRQSSLDKKGNELEKLHNRAMEQLQNISSMTSEEARTILMEEVEKEARSDMARIIRQIEAEAREEGEKKGRRIISIAIQRIASDHVSEITTSVVPLPSDEMKGRVI